MRTKSGWVRLMALLAVLLLIAVACGRDDDDDEDVGTGDTDTTADEGPKELTSAPGFDMEAGVIRVGVLTPLSGPVAGVIGIPLTEGNRVYAEKVNAAGGVAGKYKLELVEQDNQYNTDLTKTKYKQVKDQVVMFAQVLGTPPTQAVLVDLRRDNIMASPASLDAEWVSHEVLLPVGEPYQIQVINGAAWVTEQEGVENICFFGADDPYGEAGLEGLEFAGEQMDFDIAATTRYDPAPGASTDYTAQITQLKDADCDAVFVTAVVTQANQFLTKAQQLGFAAKFLMQSPSYITAFSQSPVWQDDNVIYLASDAPDWGDTSSPGMKEMIEDIQKFRPEQKPDPYFVFGYAQMKTVVALLEQAIENSDLSREGLIRAQADLGELEMNGLFGNWTYGPPEDRVIPRGTVIADIDAAAPGGIKRLERLESDAAKDFEFER